MSHSKLFIQSPALKPILSHTPGIRVALFGSEALLRCYPTQINIESDPLKGDVQILEKISLPFKGPISAWTVRRYLHKSIIEVEGRDSSGIFFRYQLFDQEKCVIFLPIKGFPADFKQQRYTLYQSASNIETSETRLDLGGYRAHIWDRIAFPFTEPNDMRELIQAIVSSISPKRPDSCFYSEKSMLKTILEMIEEEKNPDSKTLFSLLKGIFQSSLSGIFSLYPKDVLHLGYQEPAFPAGYSTAEILQIYSYAIQKMVGSYELENSVQLSPAIRALFPSGRIWNLFLEERLYKISYEWRKEKPRRVVCIANSDQQMLLDCGMPVKEHSARFGSLSAKKKRENGTDPLCLKAGIEYLYDTFLF